MANNESESSSFSIEEPGWPALIGRAIVSCGGGGRVGELGCSRRVDAVIGLAARLAVRSGVERAAGGCNTGINGWCDGAEVSIRSAVSGFW